MDDIVVVCDAGRASVQCSTEPCGLARVDVTIEVNEIESAVVFDMGIIVVYTMRWGLIVVSFASGLCVVWWFLQSDGPEAEVWILWCSFLAGSGNVMILTCVLDLLTVPVSYAEGVVIVIFRQQVCRSCCSWGATLGEGSRCIHCFFCVFLQERCGCP